MNLVLDASVVLAWCIEDEHSDYAVAVIEELRSSEAIVAAVWPLEVTNALLIAEKRKRIEAAKARKLLNLVATLPIVVDPLSRRLAFESVYSLARKHRLTSYDAAYLELAIRHGVPLATLDDALRRACKAEGLTLYSGSKP